MSEPEDRTLPTALIDEPADALRESIDPERVAALADDIAAQGLLQPIGVRGPSPAGRYEIVWGHRRLLAHRLLQRELIRCRVFVDGFDPLHARAMENVSQEPMTPIEEAGLCRRYVERGHPIAAVARLLRHSPAWVTARLALLEYPPDLRAAVQRGELSLGVAAQLAEVDDEGYRGELTREAMRAGATVPVVQAWVYHFQADRARIIANHYTIEQLAQERAAFVVMAVCESCHGQDDVRAIRSLHLCPGCMSEVREAIAAAAGARPA
jgi:ParB/RepB/Spo0J family partition protein